MDWHEEIGLGMPLKEGEYGSVSPPTRGKKKIKHLIYIYIYKVKI